MDIRPLTFEDRDQWAGLLAVAFDRTVDDMLTLLDWLHTGYGMVACGAWDGDVLAAQYSCLTMPLWIPELQSVSLVGMSVNMATHPGYRGRGLIKLVSQPVYETLTQQGAVAGVGFSNAAGVKVDRHSKGYGYNVIGKLDSVVVGLRDGAYPPLDLLENWSPEQINFPITNNGYIHFQTSAQSLHHRFACHPFRRYQYAGWREGEMMRGVVVYRIAYIGNRMPVASLLAACGDDVPELMRRWFTTMRMQGIYIAHMLVTPKSELYRVLCEITRTFRLPYSRNPYYLTAKPLGNRTAATLFDWMQWDSMGGDIL